LTDLDMHCISVWRMCDWHRSKTDWSAHMSHPCQSCILVMLLSHLLTLPLSIT